MCQFSLYFEIFHWSGYTGWKLRKWADLLDSSTEHHYICSEFIAIHPIVVEKCQQQNDGLTDGHFHPPWFPFNFQKPEVTFFKWLFYKNQRAKAKRPTLLKLKWGNCHVWMWHYSLINAFITFLQVCLMRPPEIQSANMRSLCVSITVSPETPKALNSYLLAQNMKIS